MSYVKDRILPEGISNEHRLKLIVMFLDERLQLAADVTRDFFRAPESGWDALAGIRQRQFDKAASYIAEIRALTNGGAK